MMKRLITKASAAAALTLTLMACSETNLYESQEQVSDQKQIWNTDNAERVFGVTIDENQDWSMSEEITAAVNVSNLLDDVTVSIYQTNPTTATKANPAVLLSSISTKGGKTEIMKFTMPKSQNVVYVSYKDAKGFTYTMPMGVSDGKLISNIGPSNHFVQNAKGKKRIADNQQATIPSASITRTEALQLVGLDQAVEPNWTNTTVNWDQDPNFATHFKITQPWNGNIAVLASEAAYGGAQRYVYVSSKWTLAQDEQRVGGGAIIVVDNGGEIVIPAGGLLQSVNEARLIILPGGKISGPGNITFTNGTDNFSYNGGTIEIGGTFNNNFGNFYNYGTMTADKIAGGATVSTYVNHGHVTFNNSSTGSGSANTRIYNACWWECKDMQEAKIIVNGPTSYLKAGNLKMSDGWDNTSDGAFINLASNSLMEVTGDVSLNNTSIVGPTGDYCGLSFGSVSYCNFTAYGYPNGNQPEQGRIINNIYLNVAGNTDAQGNFNHMINGIGWGKGQYGGVDWSEGSYGTETLGTGGVLYTRNGEANFAIPASECTPGIEPSPVPTPVPETTPVYTYAFEDTPVGDYDMNDVVLKVRENEADPNYLDVSIVAVGATFDLYVYLNYQSLFDGKEVHDIFGAPRGSFVNTVPGEQTYAPVTCTVPKPYGFNFADAPFAILSPGVSGDGLVFIAKAGQDPHGICVPTDWQYPTEYTCIKDAYPNFIKFAQDVADPDGKSWYVVTGNNPVAGKVY